MSKESAIKTEGVVDRALGGDNFQVTLTNGHTILCSTSGRLKQNFIKIIAGDKVTVEMSPYDLTRGRISRRLK